MNKYKNILTEPFLQQKYNIERLSTRKIAKIVGCSKTTILYYLKKYNIYRRNASETSKGNRNRLGKFHTEETKRKMRLNHADFSGKNSSSWKGGKTKDKDNYWRIFSPNHPYKDKNNYVLEHRLVVESQIGRYLTPKEVVHHINEIRDDNRPENLMGFTSQSAHKRFHKDPKLVKSNEIIFDGRKLI